jgi:hypothetical protein
MTNKIIESLREIEKIENLMKENRKNTKVVERGDLVRNAIMTPDGTVLESTHRHDYREYKDENGEVYMVDGGNDYIRRSVNKVPATPLDIYTKDKFEEVRKYLKWGTYGINGDQPLRYVRLFEIDDSHIEAVLKLNISPEYTRLFNIELEFRKTL